MKDIRDIVRDIDAINKGEVAESTVPNIVEVFKMVKKLERRVSELEAAQAPAEPQAAPAPAPAAPAAPTTQATRG